MNDDAFELDRSVRLSTDHACRFPDGAQYRIEIPSTVTSSDRGAAGLAVPVVPVRT